MQIIEAVKSALGKEIKYAKDCEQLSDEILELTNRKVSSSTLRRAFGLLKTSSKLSKFTEETLRKYVQEKTSLQSKIVNNDLSFKKDNLYNDFKDLKKLHNGLNEDFFKDLEGSNFHPYKTFKILHLAVKEAVEKEDFEFFFTLYRQSKVVLSSRRFFRFFGNQLRDNKAFADRLLPQLANEKNARRYFFELYVDFGNFRTYKNWLEIYYKSEPIYLNKLWALSLIIYGNQLSNTKHDLWEEYFELVHLCSEQIEDAHPYLKARIYGAMLINTDKKNFYHDKIMKELESNYNQHNSDETYHPYFPIMIFQYIMQFSREAEAVLQLHRIFKTYKNLNYTVEEYGIPFYVGICECILNDSHLNLIEIETFYSGHTNEDTPLKLFALQFIRKGNQNSEVNNYKQKLIAESGFISFK